MGMEHWWNDTDRGKLKYWERNLSQCHFVYKNLRETGLGSKPCLRGEKQATDRLSQGKVLKKAEVSSNFVPHAQKPLQFPKMLFGISQAHPSVSQ